MGLRRLLKLLRIGERKDSVWGVDKESQSWNGGAHSVIIEESIGVCFFFRELISKIIPTIKQNLFVDIVRLLLALLACLFTSLGVSSMCQEPPRIIFLSCLKPFPECRNLEKNVSELEIKPFDYFFDNPSHLSSISTISPLLWLIQSKRCLDWQRSHDTLLCHACNHIARLVI